MKYKIILLLVSALLLTGCGSKEEVLTCDFPNTTITITVRDGKIIKYVDKLTGEASSEEIVIMNEEYLKDVSINDAVNKLKEAIANVGGDCIREETK